MSLALFRISNNLCILENDGYIFYRNRIFKSSNLGETWEAMNSMQYDGGAEVEDLVKHGNYLMIPAYYQ